MSVLGGSIVSEITKASFWTAYTPIVTSNNAVTYSNSHGRFTEIGKLVFVELFFQLNSVTTVNDIVSVSLPVVSDRAPDNGTATGLMSYLIGHVGTFNNPPTWGSQLIFAVVSQSNNNSITTAVQLSTGLPISSLSMPQKVYLSGFYFKK